MHSTDARSLLRRRATLCARAGIDAFRFQGEPHIPVPPNPASGHRLPAWRRIRERRRRS